MINELTMTISTTKPEYIFTIVLSDLQMERLKEKRILGFRFQKEKYEFLNDLSDVLRREILLKLEQLDENQQNNNKNHREKN